MVTEDLGIKLENVKLADLGRAKRITIDKDAAAWRCCAAWVRSMT